MNVIHKEALCINCGCCVSECNSMESDPEFLGPAALAKGMRFVGDARDQATVERLDELQRRARDLGLHALLLLQRSAARRASTRATRSRSSAPRRCKHGIDRDMGAKHAKWFVTSAKTTGWLRETELVPKTQGIVASIKQMKFAMSLARHGKVPPPFPPHVAEGRRRVARALRPRQASRTARARSASSRARRRSSRIEFAPEAERREPRRASPSGSERGSRGMKRVAYYKGCLASLSAKELDISTQALAPKLGLELDELESVTCCGAGDIHEAEPDYYLHLNARILAYAEADRLRTR